MLIIRLHDVIPLYCLFNIFLRRKNMLNELNAIKNRNTIGGDNRGRYLYSLCSITIIQ